jgi:DNA-binding MarR family transcriptional regulator
MATKDPAKKFAEQALHIERVLESRNVGGNAGRVVFILAAANNSMGVTQKQLVEETALPKDVVSKLVGSLVRGGLLDQVREDGNARIKRLTTNDAGKQVIAQIKAALLPPLSKPAEPEKPVKRRPMLWEV